MVVFNRIYTRTGDDGTTALGSGERRPKYDLRVSAYGTVDETNAAIGVARLHLAELPALDAMLGKARWQMEKAAEEALSIGARSLAAVARQQAGFVDSVPPRLLALCIGGGILQGGTQ